MSTKKIAIVNTIWIIVKQIITIILQFVSRKVFLTYLGIELVSLNTTLTSIISATALAESGINSVIIFHLYRALQNEDKKDINSLINIAKVYLRFVGIIMIFLSLFISSFIKFFLTGIEVFWMTYVYFFLICLSSATSYFLAYKRLLLSADRCAYISNIIDCSCDIVFTITKIILLITWHSYFAFLILCIVQTIVSNIIVQVVCQRRYPYLKKEKADYARLKKMLKEIRELFMGTVAAYFYSSSDNVIISKFVSTIYVGLVGNYTMITTGLKTFALNAMSIISPIIGNMAAEKELRLKELRNVFLIFDYMLYVVAIIIVVPEYILLQDVVQNIWGLNYVLPFSIPCLLLLDQYIVLVQDSNGIMLSTTGYFKELKVADGTAAISNIILSVILVNFWGITGVLVGTVVSRIIQWIIKAYYAHICYWKEELGQFVSYWFSKIFDFLCMICTLVLAKKCYEHYNNYIFIMRFIFGGVTGILLGIAMSAFVGILSGDIVRIIKLILRKKQN